MKKTILPYIVFASLIVSCGNSSSSKYPEDSVRVDASKMEVEARPDTLSTVERDSFLLSLKDSISIKKEEKKSNLRTVVPKNKPAYMNDNRVYAYFKIDNDNRPTEFRLVIQYCGTGVLMATNATFVGNGKNYTYTPVEFIRQSELLGDSQVEWEWTDEELTESNQDMIEALASGDIKEMKIKGRFIFTRDLFQSETAYLRLIWNTYKHLGGKLPESAL